jgi:hypothetical protein
LHGELAHVELNFGTASGLNQFFWELLHRVQLEKVEIKRDKKEMVLWDHLLEVNSSKYIFAIASMLEARRFH